MRTLQDTEIGLEPAVLGAGLRVALLFERVERLRQERWNDNGYVPENNETAYQKSDGYLEAENRQRLIRVKIWVTKRMYNQALSQLDSLQNTFRKIQLMKEDAKYVYRQAFEGEELMHATALSLSQERKEPEIEGLATYAHTEASEEEELMRATALSLSEERDRIGADLRKVQKGLAEKKQELALQLNYEEFEMEGLEKYVCTEVFEEDELVLAAALKLSQEHGELNRIEGDLRKVQEQLAEAQQEMTSKWNELESSKDKPWLEGFLIQDMTRIEGAITILQERESALLTEHQKFLSSQSL